MEAPPSFESMPPELLGEIFYHSSILCPNAPLLLSRVSRTFNRVIHSTPCVWDRLELHISEGRDDAKSSSKAKLWFSMVGKTLMDVQVDINKPNPNPGFFPQNTAPSSFATSHVLGEHNHQIRSLHIRAPSELESKAFVNAIYNRVVNDSESFALECLSITITSPAPSTLRPPSPCGALPRLPRLRRLKLVNHSISLLASTRFEELRSLSITCPIRFPPLHLDAVLDVLRGSPQLEKLSIESRILDSPHATSSGVEHLDSHPDLIHLPHLTQLSLRTNFIPNVLSHLLLPNLSKLHIDDLNGRRPDSSQQTGSVLRQLLVRMELPNEHRFGTGLKVLELVGVEICRTVDVRKDGVWEWCFRRMKTLQQLSVSKVDPAPLLDILSLRVDPDSDNERENGQGDLPCPRLERLSIAGTVLPLNAESFKRHRPALHVEIDVIRDPFSPTSPGGPIDFLSLHTADVGVRSPSASKPGSPEASPRLRTPNLPRFGPWLVLAQRPGGDGARDHN